MHNVYVTISFWCCNLHTCDKHVYTCMFVHFVLLIMSSATWGTCRNFAARKYLKKHLKFKQEKRLFTSSVCFCRWRNAILSGGVKEALEVTSWSITYRWVLAYSLAFYLTLSIGNYFVCSSHQLLTTRVSFTSVYCPTIMSFVTSNGIEFNLDTNLDTSRYLMTFIFGRTLKKC